MRKMPELFQGFMDLNPKWWLVSAETHSASDELFWRAIKFAKGGGGKHIIAVTGDKGMPVSGNLNNSEIERYKVEETLLQMKDGNAPVIVN